MEWQWLKDWWRLKRWRNIQSREESGDEFCYCDECLPDVSLLLKLIHDNDNYLSQTQCFKYISITLPEIL